MSFDCPKCGAKGKGVLLFVSVAPCDECAGIKPEPEHHMTGRTTNKLQYQVMQHRDLLQIGPYHSVALSCGATREYVEKADHTYFAYILYGDTSITSYILNRPERFCVVRWY